MPTIIVTAASGQLGRLVINELLETEAANRIVAGVRDTEGAAATEYREKGIEVRHADYSLPHTLTSAFSGVDRLLLISSSENGQRIVQHRNVVDAAKDAGVSLIAYTSILHADKSPLFLAQEHRDTEAALKESGIPTVLLRNGWYSEVFTWRLPMAIKTGALIGAAGDGRISSAARADYARAAASVLIGEGHAGRIYELAGDDAFTLAQLAAVVSETINKVLPYQNLSGEAFRSAAVTAGVPEMFAMILADTDVGISNGALFEDGGDLSRLIGKTTPFAETIQIFLRTLQSEKAHN
jgi:NAD(P)H dehydrogenase (quinone)